MRRLILPAVLLAIAGFGGAPAAAAATPSAAVAPERDNLENPENPETSAEALGLTHISRDLSRQHLFAHARAGAVATPSTAVVAKGHGLEPAAAAPGASAVAPATPVKGMNVPKKDAILGLDISHYTPRNVPIESLASRNILFLYMKATQGHDGLDPSFAQFWKRAGLVRVHRGAYHFLTSGDPAMRGAEWGRIQANTFIRVITANKGILPTDMPPVVDVEWDMVTDELTEQKADQWKQRSATEIVAMISAFCAEIQARLHRTPMIYTSRAWWQERLGPAAMPTDLTKYPIWLADYSLAAEKSDNPQTIVRGQWNLWQYTEAAVIDAVFDTPLDASIFNGDLKQFHAFFGIEDFERNGQGLSPADPHQTAVLGK